METKVVAVWRTLLFLSLFIDGASCFKLLLLELHAGYHGSREDTCEADMTE